MPVQLTGTERLVVWLPTWLGDNVMAEPLVTALGERAGEDARLTIIAPRFAAALWGVEGALAAATWVDAADDAAIEAALRQAQAVLLLRNSFRSAWRAWRAGVPQRIGFARDGRRALLTDSMVPARRRRGTKAGLLVRPFSDEVLELGAMVGALIARTQPRIQVQAEWAARAAARLGPELWKAGFAVVNVGGRAGSAKALPDWTPIVAGLLEAGVHVVLVTGPGEEARLDAVLGDPAIQAAGASTAGARGARCYAWRDPVCDLGELAALGQRCRVALTTDGGPRHVLAAAGARVVVLFGPTDPHHTAAHLERTISLVGAAPCGPCHLERCNQLAPDIQRCFRSIAPQEVLAAALS
jgi:heptosyltransferase II